MSALASIEDRLWVDIKSRIDDVAFSDMRVLVLGFDTVERTWLRNSLRFIGVSATASAFNVGQLASVAGMGLSFTHVILNLDGYECLDDAVDALLNFRRLAPFIVVVAVSSRLSGDDLGQERRAICDATLRLPLSERRLRRGLLEGRANNCDLQRILRERSA
jgi:hypothetical protein